MDLASQVKCDNELKKTNTEHVCFVTFVRKLKNHNLSCLRRFELSFDFMNQADDNPKTW